MTKQKNGPAQRVNVEQGSKNSFARRTLGHWPRAVKNSGVRYAW